MMRFCGEFGKISHFMTMRFRQLLLSGRQYNKNHSFCSEILKNYTRCAIGNVFDLYVEYSTSEYSENLTAYWIQ